QGSGTGLDYAHDLLGNGTGAPHGPAGEDILPEGIETGKPVHSVVGEKTLVLSPDKGLDQKFRDVMKTDLMGPVPLILKRDVQRLSLAVQKRLLHELSTAGRG